MAFDFYPLVFSSSFSLYLFSFSSFVLALFVLAVQAKLSAADLVCTVFVPAKASPDGTLPKIGVLDPARKTRLDKMIKVR